MLRCLRPPFFIGGSQRDQIQSHGDVTPLLGLGFPICSKELVPLDHVFFPKDHLTYLPNTQIPRPLHHRLGMGPGPESRENTV